MKEFIEKLIGGLREQSAYSCGQCMDEAIEVVCKIAEEYKGGWIPCSERVPEEGVDVLVWFEYYRYGSYNRLYQTVGISYTYHGDWSGFVNGSSGWKQLRIIAWQPLPEPYKEGGTV